jgi:hypothetical protein
LNWQSCIFIPLLLEKFRDAVETTGGHCVVQDLAMGTLLN